MLSDNDLAWIATEIACEINSIRCQERMSITAFRQALAHLPGGANMTMRYGSGGRTQIFMIGDDEVEVGPDATAADIEAELNKKKVKPMNIQSSPLQQFKVRT